MSFDNVIGSHRRNFVIFYLYPEKIKPLRWEIEGIYAFLDNVSFLVPAPWYFI